MIETEAQDKRYVVRRKLIAEMEKLLPEITTIHGLIEEKYRQVAEAFGIGD